MPVLDDVKMYARFGAGLPGYLRRRITLAEAEETIRRNLASREENFLKVAEECAQAIQLQLP